MLKGTTAFFVGGITTGLILIFNFLTSLPDGKLHIIFCDVGQGDAAYIRFPDGRDMLVDGGPNNKVLGCLGRYMPFWDRALDIVMLTHPEKDHLQGLLGVLERYRVDHLVRSNIVSTTEGYKKFIELIKTKHIRENVVTYGERVSVGSALLAVVGPVDVLGTTTGHVNEYSVVFWLRYGEFDALFTGDATMSEPFGTLANDHVEVLKVPHHGSKTGVSLSFLDWLKPQLSIISVGNNSYGHPTKELLTMLAVVKSQVLRTDQEGDIEIVSDGTHWLRR